MPYFNEDLQHKANAHILKPLTQKQTIQIVKGLLADLKDDINEIRDDYLIGVSVSQDGKILSITYRVGGDERTISFTGGVDGISWGQITGTLLNQTDLQNALDNKVDKVSGYGLMSNDEHTKLSGISSGAQVNVLEGVQKNGVDLPIVSKKVNIIVDNVLSNSSHNPIENQVIAQLIPNEASSSNKLADKAFVNSSIATNTATFRGTYYLIHFDDETLPDLGFDNVNPTYQQVGAAIKTKLASLSTPIVPENNDYVFVQIPVSADTPSVIARIDRYKCISTVENNPTDDVWEYEYSLNNSSFTASQWAAINSAITTAKVTSYNDHLANTSNPHSVTASQVGLGNVDNKSEATIKSDFTGSIANGDTGFVTGGDIYTALQNFSTNGKVVEVTSSNTYSEIATIIGAGNIPLYKTLSGYSYLSGYTPQNGNSLGSVTFLSSYFWTDNKQRQGLYKDIISSNGNRQTKAIYVEASNDKVSSIVNDGSSNDNTQSTVKYTSVKAVVDYVSGKQNAITSNSPLESDVVTDTNQTHKFVTSAMYDYLDNQLYQKPTVDTFALLGTIDGGSSQSVSGKYETGSTIIVSSIRHKETNINNIDTLYIYFRGVALEAITKSDSVIDVNLSSPQTITNDVSSLLKGTDTKGNTFSKGVNIEFVNYVYYTITSSTTTPTTGLTKSVAANTTTTGFNVSYVAGDYIYFYHTSSGKKVQQYALGQWNDVTSTSLGSVTITKANGTTGTYYCYRVGSFVAGGTDQFRIA